jgi:hypothetical protein
MRGAVKVNALPALQAILRGVASSGEELIKLL